MYFQYLWQLLGKESENKYLGGLQVHLGLKSSGLLLLHGLSLEVGGTGSTGLKMELETVL